LTDKRLIIALTGRAGSGKSTAGHRFTDHSFQRMRFAGPLKAMLITMGLTPDHTDGALKEVPCALLGGRTPRHAMQTLGGEWGRDMIAPTLWTNAAIMAIDALPAGQAVYLDDMRYPNELDALKARADYEVHVVAIVNPRVPGPYIPKWWQFWLAKPHISETWNAPADFTIVNDGTIAQLGAVVDMIVARVRPAPPEPREEKIERIAEELFRSWPYTGPRDGKPDWIKGGNSLMQDSARRQATSIVDGEPKKMVLYDG
jgi:hypothetical protein